jgi:hypothetical protein
MSTGFVANMRHCALPKMTADLRLTLEISWRREAARWALLQLSAQLATAQRALAAKAPALTGPLRLQAGAAGSDW